MNDGYSILTTGSQVYSIVGDVFYNPKKNKNEERNFYSQKHVIHRILNM